MEYGLEHIFHINAWPDVMGEDALNEKCCIEVLRRLTKKAESEIEELEGDLFILKTQLEWAEKNKYKEWFDICCKGLREQIHKLKSKSSLEDNHTEDSNCKDIQSYTSKEPQKRIHEIVEALLRNQDKHEQVTSEDLTKPSSSVIENRSADLDEQGMRPSDAPERKSGLQVLKKHMDKILMKSVKVENEELGSPSTSKDISLTPYMKLPRQRTNGRIKSEIFEAQESFPTNSGKAISRGVRLLSPQHMDVKSTKSDMIVQKPSAALKVKKLCSTSFSKSKGTGKHKKNQMEGQEPTRRSQKISNDYKAFLKSQEKKAYNIVKKEPAEPKIPVVASTELLKLRGFTAEDTTMGCILNSIDKHESENEINREMDTKPVDLNMYTVSQLRELAKSLGVTGLGEYRKVKLVELLAEILIE